MVYLIRVDSEHVMNLKKLLNWTRFLVFIVVIFVGFCTREDINSIVRYENVDSMFIYDPTRESTHAVLSFTTAKFQGVFRDKDELIDQISRQYYSMRPIADISDEPIAHFRAIRDTMQNMQISNIEHGEQVSIFDWIANDHHAFFFLAGFPWRRKP